MLENAVFLPTPAFSSGHRLACVFFRRHASDGTFDRAYLKWQIRELLCDVSPDVFVDALQIGVAGLAARHSLLVEFAYPVVSSMDSGVWPPPATRSVVRSITGPILEFPLERALEAGQSWPGGHITTYRWNGNVKALEHTVQR